MKIIALIQVLCWISVSDGFMQYPLSAKYFLGRFLSSMEENQIFRLDKMIPGDQCNRECKPNDVRVCRFHFMMKYFQVMGG